MAKVHLQNTSTSRGKSSLHARRPDQYPEVAPACYPLYANEKTRLVAELGEGLVLGNVGRRLDAELAGSLLRALVAVH